MSNTSSEFRKDLKELLEKYRASISINDGWSTIRLEVYLDYYEEGEDVQLPEMFVI